MFRVPVFSDTIINICFGSCETDNCVAPIDSFTVSLAVNTSAIMDAASSTLFWTDEFIPAPGIPLTDEDQDGIYTGSFTAVEGYTTTYLFANGDCPDQSCYEDLTDENACDNTFGNLRFLPPISQDTLISTCFGECRPDLDCNIQTIALHKFQVWYTRCSLIFFSDVVF